MSSWLLLSASSLLLSGCQSFGTGAKVQPHIAAELSRDESLTMSAPAQPPAEFADELLSSVATDLSAPTMINAPRFDVVANEVAPRTQTLLEPIERGEYVVEGFLV